jgi:hypothetical protein
MDRSSFPFFVGAVLTRESPKAPSGRAPEVGGQVLTKPLALPAFTVQNGRAKSWVTLCSTTVDRAEISRINGLAVEVNQPASAPRSAAAEPKRETAPDQG